MKWVKHMTASHDDERMAALLDKGGIEGYGFYWLLLEHVAGSVEKASTNATLTYPLTQWARRLHSHPNRVSKYLGVLGVVGLVKVESVEGMVRVSIPNILKYRDEYSTRKPKYPDTDPTDTRARSEKEADTEADTETETPTPSAPNGAGEQMAFVTVTEGTTDPVYDVQSNRGMQVISKPADELKAVISEVAERIHERHPKPSRDIGVGQVAKKLGTIAERYTKSERVAAIRRVDANHADWCQCERWTKDGGQFAKGLENWLAPTMGRYEAEAPPPAETKHDRTMAAFDAAMAYEAEVERRLAGQTEPRRIAQGGTA